MKRIVGGLLLAVVLGVAIFFTWRMMSPPPADLDVSRSKTSEAGLYQVTIAPELDPFDRSTMHNWSVRVTTPAGQGVADARIAVDGGMPQHGHGLPTAPQVSATDTPGDYLLEGVRFGMGGWWVLRFTIDAAAGSDAVEFNLAL